jgi:hypothetical protein
MHVAIAKTHFGRCLGNGARWAPNDPTRVLRFVSLRRQVFPVIDSTPSNIVYQAGLGVDKRN